MEVDTCGTKVVWRTPNPDFWQVAKRYGQLEHVIIQLDFLRQVERVPFYEYYIPYAASNGSKGPGFADIVSVRDKEIWEIKPDWYQQQAVDEAMLYVECARKYCDPKWHLGTSYHNTENTGVIFTYAGCSLHAKQENLAPLFISGNTKEFFKRDRSGQTIFRERCSKRLRTRFIIRFR